MKRLGQLIGTYKFPAFLVGVIALGMILVGVSMRIYYVSGAFQLDLSRPEYTEVRAQIDPVTKNHDDFPGQGEVDVLVLDDFLNRYKTEADKVTQAAGFADGALGDQQLGIDSGNQQ